MYPLFTGWWFQPFEKYESQLGWLFPIYGKIKAMFQTTKQFLDDLPLPTIGYHYYCSLFFLFSSPTQPNPQYHSIVHQYSVDIPWISLCIYYIIIYIYIFPWCHYFCWSNPPNLCCQFLPYHQAASLCWAISAKCSELPASSWWNR